MITLVWGINVIKVFKKFLGWGGRSCNATSKRLCGVDMNIELLIQVEKESS